MKILSKSYLVNAQDSGCGEKRLNLLMQLLYQSVSLPG